jgi:NAD(P)-dependent dehydrogenase (short-subunit alcohol dehydrogenase family)
MSDGVDLSGKAIVVTGGGRGLGAAVAKAVATEGAAVVLNDVDAEPANECVTSIRAAGGHLSDPGLEAILKPLDPPLDGGSCSF